MLSSFLSLQISAILKKALTAAALRRLRVSGSVRFGNFLRSRPKSGILAMALTVPPNSYLIIYYFGLLSTDYEPRSIYLYFSTT